ncbi:unnamed protein product [Cylicocyclus nassatus]|uniref:Uncharacterized protein n=1 Tax=Cylicocyclus nassatus TaxID=53992 RepID=A0AA36GX15_CYLNA|nr:unnamed protein product [Cylicocyclus nassatus]
MQLAAISDQLLTLISMAENSDGDDDGLVVLHPHIMHDDIISTIDTRQSVYWDACAVVVILAIVIGIFVTSNLYYCCGQGLFLGLPKEKKSHTDIYKEMRKKRPKKMKSEEIDMSLFKVTEPLVHMRDLEGEVKHAMDTMKSAEIVKVQFDPALNEFTRIGSTIDVFNKSHRKTFEELSREKVDDAVTKKPKEALEKKPGAPQVEKLPIGKEDKNREMDKRKEQREKKELKEKKVKDAEMKSPEEAGAKKEDAEMKKPAERSGGGVP